MAMRPKCSGIGDGELKYSVREWRNLKPRWNRSDNKRSVMPMEDSVCLREPAKKDGDEILCSGITRIEEAEYSAME